MRFFYSKSIAVMLSLMMAAAACNPEKVGAPAGAKETEPTGSPASPCASAEECASFEIAFSRYNSGSRESQVMASRLDGSGMIRLTTGYDIAPVWSPDGSSIAFGRWRRMGRAFPYEVCVLSLTDGFTRCIEAEFDKRPSWSPDGSEVAFIGRTPADYAQAPRRRLYALSATDMELRVITDNVGTFCRAGVSWSPDGDRIALTSSAQYRCGVVTAVKRDGSDPKVVFTPESDTLSIAQLAWSPNGQQLAVLVSLFEGGCWDLCSTAIGVMNADGTGLTLLVKASWELGEGVVDPVWSRSGDRIFYSKEARCDGGICPGVSIESVAPDGSARSVVLFDAREPSLRR